MTTATPQITHPLVALIGQTLVGNALVEEAFGPHAKVTGKGWDDRYLDAPERGIEAAATNKSIVTAVFFKAGGVEGATAYAGALPNGLTFAQDRRAVRAMLGTPVRSGEAGGEGIFAIAHSWDRFEADSIYLRTEYETGDSAIRMVTIGQIET